VRFISQSLFLRMLSCIFCDCSHLHIALNLTRCGSWNGTWEVWHSHPLEATAWLSYGRPTWMEFGMSRLFLTVVDHVSRVFLYPCAIITRCCCSCCRILRCFFLISCVLAIEIRSLKDGACTALMTYRDTSRARCKQFLWCTRRTIATHQCSGDRHWEVQKRKARRFVLEVVQRSPEAFAGPRPSTCSRFCWICIM